MTNPSPGPDPAARPGHSPPPQQERADALPYASRGPRDLAARDQFDDDVALEDDRSLLAQAIVLAILVLVFAVLYVISKWL